MLLASLLLLACAGGASDPAGGASGDGGASDGAASDGGARDGGASDGGASDGGGDGPPAGVLVLAGGGTEGEVGDSGAWSAALYGALLEGGDVSGDGRVRVAVLATGEESDWLPGYLEWLGADEAFNLPVPDRASAGDPAVAEALAGCDAVFLKGGDQGAYYDAWNDTPLEDALRSLHQERGGGVGGTSAGAMSLSGYALAGGMDLVSDDVLADSHTPYLDDRDGGSGVHDDFLGLLPGALVDTHYTERARLGRLLGAMALAIDEGAPTGLLGVGIEQQTGLVLRGAVATVHGAGTVSFVRDGGGERTRQAGAPLTWTGLRVDRLTAGWRFRVDTAEVDLGAIPAGAVALAPPAPVPSEGGLWAVDGHQPADEERCGWIAARDSATFAIREGEAPPLLAGAACLVRAHDSEQRALADEALHALLAEVPGAVGFLVATESSLERAPDAPDRLWFTANPDLPGAERATIVVDASAASWASRGAAASPYDGGAGALRPTGLVGLRVHVLADTAGTGLGYDLQSRAVVNP